MSEQRRLTAPRLRSPSVIDSSARASALASGRADVVFWTRTCTAASDLMELSEKEKQKLMAGLNEEELTVVQQIDSIFEDAGFDFARYAKRDIPKGTIVTQPYYTVPNVPVVGK